jgi:two-component system phosphate regulon sensor histidine kinase PhoR
VARATGSRFVPSEPRGGPLTISKTAWRYVAWIVAIALVAAAIGLVMGRVVGAVAVALAALLLGQLRNLIRLDTWLRTRATTRPPELPGLWGDVVAVVSRIYRRKVFHKRRVLGLLREFRRMTSAMPDGAILLGPNREILWFNRAAARWLDLRRKVDYGLRIDNLLRQPEFIEYIDKQGAAPPPRIHFPHPDDRWLSFRLVTANTAGQQLLLVRDVSNEARLESMRRDFVANASHELRSPLTVISGYLDTLAEEGDLGPEWREPVREMRRQSDRMRSILQDLLELSKLEAGGGSAEREPVDVSGMLALMRKEVLSRTERPATFELALDTDRQILGSESELHSIFWNLVSNALKYTPADGRVDVRWWVDERGGHVEVRDTGIGISAEHLPRLTERFYRVDPGRARSLGGSGLGLAIVKHALQRHGGRLQIESIEGRGSTFTCHFPLERIVPAERIDAS